ncbi:hypothetical protein [Neorhodopirellula pilleata]|uniref:Uncharacterized protein n=1 Tax=Neorhodopirellula pilleata TaxID=2714738 RepID=A0A5C5ZY56_9BACT|nr:hypothetical protein [Neorhodopirellula pilleata]TWT92602.1 hypothetical protein Pla100_46220 [Neorhodopirellula pilleata]
MFDAFQLIPALQIIFAHEIEFQENSFVELTVAQYDAMKRRGQPRHGKMYRIVHFEPEAIERTPEKITLELTIASESDRQLILDAVEFVHRASQSMSKENPTFADRLKYLRPRLPPIITQSSF